MKNTLEFLKDLVENNDRDWFEENRSRYESSHEEVKTLFSDIAEKLAKHDLLDTTGSKVFRIYRDVRFSKDKAPYKKSRSMVFRRAGDDRRGGYYLHVEPGNIFLATGFWEPDPADLLHIRKHIQQSDEMLRDVLNDKVIKNYFGEMQGEQLKTAPKGFDKDDPAIDLLRYKRFILSHEFTEKELLSDNFSQLVSEGFKKARPFLDCMTEYLTTDLNGVPLA
ncbi:MAG: DUF2461 domain-containing protein [Cyclobacteriaceae bacterium]